MKAQSITRPWDSLILRCGKNIENRTWNTFYRGWLLIHAAKSWDDSALDFANNVETVLGRDLGVCRVPRRAENNPAGLVGIVDLVDVCEVTVGNEDVSCGCGPWAMPGQYHWQLRRPRPFTVAIPCRGMPALWTPPAAVAGALALEVAACLS